MWIWYEKQISPTESHCRKATKLSINMAFSEWSGKLNPAASFVIIRPQSSMKIIR